MGKQYPIETWTTGNRKNRPAIENHNCDHCNDTFIENEQVIIRETQVNYFRGDDEVEFFHYSCALAVGYKK